MKSGCDATPRSRAGFTLLEIVIVLGIASVILTFAGLTFSGYFQRTSARRAAALFMQDLTSARGYAIRSREPVVVYFDEGGLWYRVSTRNTSTEVTRRRFGDGEDIELSALALNTAGDSIVFTARGIADFLPDSGVLGVATFSSGPITYTVSFNGMGASKIDQT